MVMFKAVKKQAEENNIEHNTPVEITGKDIKIYPHYNNNFGFFTAVIDKIQFIILKGQYSDNIRYITGRPDLNNAEINTLLDTILKQKEWRQLHLKWIFSYQMMNVL